MAQANNIYRNEKGEVVLIPNFGYRDVRFKGLCHTCGIKHGDSTKTWPTERTAGRCRCCGVSGWVTDDKYYGSPVYSPHVAGLA